jgi:uncharacterized protein
LLKKLVADIRSGGIEEKDILMMNFDDPSLRAKILSQPSAFFQQLEQTFGQKLENITSKKYLFLDEAQKLPEIFDLLKIIHDNHPKKIKIFLSGSSSLNILKRTSETLVGRARLYYLSSFSWKEIITPQINSKITSLIETVVDDSFGKEKYLEIQAPLFRQKENVFFHFNRYLLNGGLPEIFFIDDEMKRSEALNNYLKIYLEQEVRLLPQIGNEHLFFQTLDVFLLRDSQLLNLSKLSSELGIQRITFKNYQNVLEQTFLLSTIYPFVSKIKQTVKSPKTYFFDHGLVNFSQKNFNLQQLEASPNEGCVLENIIIGNTLRHFANDPQKSSVNFWRDYEGHEIDLVISDRNKKPVPIEITLAKKLSRKKINNFKAFYEAFPDARDGFIVHGSDFETIPLGKKTLYAIPFWMWL